jgi:agmatine deiminase
MNTKRLPSEWEEQEGIQLTWPHENSDWAGMLEIVEPCFVKIAKEISLREKVLIVCADKNKVLKLLQHEKANLQNINLVELASNDVWARDHAPITIEENNTFTLLDFSFNGWGLKYKANFDNQISRELIKKGIFQNTNLQTIGFVLEGGGIESDGKGTILTTTQCLLSPNRNPHFSKLQIEENLKEYFGAKQILWLEHGFMSGDDTDSHIDTLARFCNEDTIAYVSCNEPKDIHYEELKSMETELRNLKQLNGKPYNLVKLPFTKAIYDEDGNRLPSTYANFLIINEAVLLPIYNDPKDTLAIEILQNTFPQREIIPIDCSALILQRGSLHCATMQFPKGVKF